MGEDKVLEDGTEPLRRGPNGVSILSQCGFGAVVDLGEPGATQEGEDILRSFSLSQMSALSVPIWIPAVLPGRDEDESVRRMGESSQRIHSEPRRSSQ